MSKEQSQGRKTCASCGPEGTWITNLSRVANLRKVGNPAYDFLYDRALLCCNSSGVNPHSLNPDADSIYSERINCLDFYFGAGESGIAAMSNEQSQVVRPAPVDPLKDNHQLR